MREALYFIRLKKILEAITKKLTFVLYTTNLIIMKIKFLLAVMLLAAVNVFAQTPTFSSISGPILPNDIVTINGTNLIGVTKVVLKWNDPSNTNTLTITPYSVTSTAISFMVPDTSFFWYAHYNFYNSIDFKLFLEYYFFSMAKY